MKRAVTVLKRVRWVACGILGLGMLAIAPSTLIAQQISTLAELQAAANEAWSRQRNHNDLDLEMAIEQQTVVTGLPNQPDIDSTSSLVRFAHKNLLFLKSVSTDEAGNETEHILASNAENTFHVSRTAGAAWRLNTHEFECATEKLADGQNEAHSKLMLEIKRGLDDDYRYQVSGQHVADFLADQRIERVTSNTRGFKNQSIRNYRPLTMDEVAAIQEQCRLEAYGLSVPSRGAK